MVWLPYQQLLSAMVVQQPIQVLVVMRNSQPAAIRCSTPCCRGRLWAATALCQPHLMTRCPWVASLDVCHHLQLCAAALMRSGRWPVLVQDRCSLPGSVPVHQQPHWATPCLMIQAWNSCSSSQMLVLRWTGSTRANMCSSLCSHQHSSMFIEDRCSGTSSSSTCSRLIVYNSSRHCCQLPTTNIGWCTTVCTATALALLQLTMSYMRRIFAWVSSRTVPAWLLIRCLLA